MFEKLIELNNRKHIQLLNRTVWKGTKNNPAYTPEIQITKDVATKAIEKHIIPVEYKLNDEQHCYVCPCCGNSLLELGLSWLPELDVNDFHYEDYFDRHPYCDRCGQKIHYVPETPVEDMKSVFGVHKQAVSDCQDDMQVKLYKDFMPEYLTNDYANGVIAETLDTIKDYNETAFDSFSTWKLQCLKEKLSKLVFSEHSEKFTSPLTVSQSEAHDYIHTLLYALYAARILIRDELTKRQASVKNDA
jgi:hypothetical protein